jgi:uncharacterized protein (DUF2237 family)
MGSKNVFGDDLALCSTDPVTGFTRSGGCETGQRDTGSHTVCAKVTKEFLDFSRSKGNDLITPAPEIGFPGLKPGDCWCLCAARWKEALEAGCAPGVILVATHQRALETLCLEELKSHAIDLA